MPRSPWVALVGPEVEENLALRYLASALTEAGLRSEIVPFNEAHDMPAVLEALCRDEPPSLVALSFAFQWRAPDVLALSLALRERGYRGHVTGGGHFGTFGHSELLRDFPEIDSICLYEAEDTLRELASALATGRPLDGIAGLAWRDPAGVVQQSPLRPRKEIDRLPWPDRSGEPARVLGHALAPLVASRGCYANCAFCCIAAWHRLSEGPSLRLRPIDDVADEMAWLHHRRGIEIFVFHDDNFFLPRPKDSLRRIEALAAGLAERGVKRFATVVKARPNDVTPEVFALMRDRLRLVRVFVGIESASTSGLRTLRRGTSPRQNERALRLLDRLGLYACFNLLAFDPDTTLDSLETNLAFMEQFAEVPFNFGRVELYAGTPLLARMQAEGRCHGDYLGFDYRLQSPEIERVFELALDCFRERNFAPDALANRLMGTRFEAEVGRLFHPATVDDSCRREAKALSRALALDSVAALRRIVAHVRSGADAASDRDLADRLRAALRRSEAALGRAAHDIEHRLRSAAPYLQECAK